MDKETVWAHKQQRLQFQMVSMPGKQPPGGLGHLVTCMALASSAWRATRGVRRRVLGFLRGSGCVGITTGALAFWPTPAKIIVSEVRRDLCSIMGRI